MVVDHVVATPEATGTYLAVLDASGELVVAVSNMRATDLLTVAQLLRSRDLIGHADLVVLDGNVPADAATWVLDQAAAGGVPVVVDPVSVAKAQAAGHHAVPRAARCSPSPPTSTSSCAIVGEPVAQTRPAIARAARQLHDRGVEHVWVRRGVRGSLLSSREPGGRVAVTVMPAPGAEVVDVTGAGDSMTAAFVHALLRGDSPVDAARFGQAAAALTVASDRDRAARPHRPSRRRRAAYGAGLLTPAANRSAHDPAPATTPPQHAAPHHTRPDQENR